MTVKVKVPLVVVAAEVKRQVPGVLVVADTPVALVTPVQLPLTTAPDLRLPARSLTVNVALPVYLPLASVVVMAMSVMNTRLAGGVMEADETVFFVAS